jgi:hypothetical protein
LNYTAEDLVPTAKQSIATIRPAKELILFQNWATHISGDSSGRSVLTLSNITAPSGRTMKKKQCRVGVKVRDVSDLFLFVFFSTLLKE